ncbi:hypothetical protein GF412_02190 [Candidatus Micrarchaeota archaeon]|nr:hypothetical protein [Candidatus Micrarchaeota archaeon]MBD3417772.1 hypothetical protein [Candidatus Micrarchaeota archaeon]
MLLKDIMSKLSIVEVSSLYPHEQTIEVNLKRLQEAMFNLGQLVDPLVTDRKTGVVLDGNHRLAVLKNIEIPNAVVQPVDYSDDSIGLGTWLPVSQNHLSEGDFERIGEKTEPVDFEAGKKAVDSLQAIFMMVRDSNGKKQCTLVSPDSYDLVSMTEKQKSLISSLSNIPFEYYSDDRMDIQLNKGRTVLFRRSYKKDEVVKEALAGRPFPPKSTRHTIPDRIIRLNMRLGWLLEDKDAAYSLLEEMLKHRVYAGNVRRYPEPVIVIY